MAFTGKIFKDSTNVFQDEAKILFDYYIRAAESIVAQEERIEGEIKALEDDRAKVEALKSDTWKWLLTIVAFFMYFVRNSRYGKQIAAINAQIDKKRKEHQAIFRDYKVTKMGVAYVPLARRVAYEGKSFVVDFAGLVPQSTVSFSMSRQSALLSNTVSQLDNLTKEAPVVESSNEPERIPTDDYSLSIQEVNEGDYIGKIDRALRTISFCLSDVEVKSVELPLVPNEGDYCDFLREYATSDTGGHPEVRLFDTSRYDSQIGEFAKINSLKADMSSDSDQFEDVLKHIMLSMAKSVQTISAMKLASTGKIVAKSNDLLLKLLKSPYNHYSPLLEAEEIRRIRNEKFDYADSIQGYEPFKLRESSRVKLNLFADEWLAEDNSRASVPFGVHQIYEEIVAPMVQRLMAENRVERIKIYGQIHDQKLSYLNKWHQDVDAFYRSNHAEGADIINNMQQTLSEYVEAYNTLAQLQKTLDSMQADDASLDDATVQSDDDSAESLAAFELQAQEFKKAQDDFSDYMDRLQEDIALKAETFGHVEFYDARLQDGYSNSVAVAASEVPSLDDRRRPIAAANPLLAKEADMLPQPKADDVLFEHLSLNLPSLAINALDEVSKAASKAFADDEEHEDDSEAGDEQEEDDDDSELDDSEDGDEEYDGEEYDDDSEDGEDGDEEDEEEDDADSDGEDYEDDGNPDDEEEDDGEEDEDADSDDDEQDDDDADNGNRR